MYESPIELIYKDIQMKFEDDIYSAVQEDIVKGLQ